MIISYLIEFITSIPIFFDAIGLIIITSAALIAIVKIVKIILKRKKYPSLKNVRLNLTERIILGLEFFIIGDIIRSIFAFSYPELIRLIVIVGIRLVLAYFLEKEIKGKY